VHNFPIRMRILLITTVCLVLVAATAIARNAVPTHAAAAINKLTVSVGYAEDKHQSSLNPGAFPVPWQGSPNTIFLGNPVYGSSSCGSLPHCFDAGAIRLDNYGLKNISVSSVSVDDHSSIPGGKIFNLWGTFTVPAGKSVILTENPPGNNPPKDNFDTSGAPSGNCTPISIPPTVTITIAGVPTTLVDSTHVLDTNGVDTESCSVQQNESIQWRQIGTTGVKTATLSLSPGTTTLAVGQQVTETATLLDGSGNPLPNANVNFTVTNGPDEGQTGSFATDQTGQASFTYTNTAPGMDIVIASVTTAYTVGPFMSNQTSVFWSNGGPVTWTGTDIGNPALAGSDSVSNGSWTISGSGTDIGGTADQFHFVWQPLVGDGGIRAQVLTQTNTNSRARAGVMLRQSTDPDAPFYAVVMTPQQGIFVLDRTSRGGGVHTVANIAGTVPIYLQVERSGTTYTAYTSSDGITWTSIAGSSVVLSPAGTWLAGMAVTSHTVSQLSTATFDTVSTP
jgi:Bacterial Ig-like domain (group 1)